MRNTPIYLLISVILVVIALAVFFISSEISDIKEEKVGVNVLDFLNAQAGVDEFSLIRVVSKSGFYEVKVDGEDGESSFYVTKNGKSLMTGLGLIELNNFKQNSMWLSPSNQDTLSDRPKVELFVMAHDPYTLQTEKGIIPVLKILKDKIDFELKFAYYSINGMQEINEQLNQYCIQKEQKNKFIDYLTCFLDNGDGDECLTSLKIDKSKLEICREDLDTEFNIIANLNDKSKWVGSTCPEEPYCFFPFNVDEKDNEKYNVDEFPLLIINGKSEITPKDPASLQRIICNSFLKDYIPEECSVELTSQIPSLGFGFFDN